MKRLALLVFLGCMCTTVFAQPCTYRDSFKPTLTSTCATYTIGPYVGWAQFCNTTGYTGSGRYTVLKVCTDSAASCINLTPSPGTYTGNMEITLFTGCWTNSPTGYVNNSYRCINNSTGLYSTEGLGLSPNTCYVAAIWTKDTGTFQICRQITPKPGDDTCLGATNVPYVAASYNTSCYSHDTAKEPNNTCVAGVLKKSRWFKYVLTCDTFARFYFGNMNCIGGTSGYHISYFTGSCGSLAYLGCSSGTGGTFSTSVGGLSIGQTIYILVNGNYGSNCGFTLRTDTPVIAKTITQNLSICNGKSIVVSGIPRTAAGTYRDTIWKTCGGASIIDSIRIFNLTIRPTSTITIDTSICQGKSIFFKGQNRASAGTYRDTIIKANGCDSILILNLAIKTNSFKIIDSQICQGKSIMFNSIARSTSGSYLDTLTSAIGCDSFITLNLTVNPTPTTNIYDTICQGGSRLFNGFLRTTNGIFSDTLLTSKSCDSFILLHLHVKPTSTKTLDTAICQGKSIFFKGQNRTTAGTYRDTLINSKGCDSFVILNLTIKNTSTTILNSSICQGSFVFFKGQNRTTAGTYRDTLINSQTCDSIIILNLTVRPHSYTTLNMEICSGQSIFFNSILRTTSGIYLDTLTSANVCDSFITLNLTVNPTPSINIFDTICQGGSRLFNGILRTSNGIYRDTLLTSKNCDSFILLNLHVKLTSTKNIDTAICQGKSIFFKGQNRTTTGTYRDTFINSKGCDSFVILNLTIKNSSNTNLTSNICQGGFIFFKGQNRTTTGVYRDTLTNAVGCDSFITLNLTVYPINTTNLNISICTGNSYFFKGQNRTTTGTYRDTVKTTFNCDSFIILNLTVLPSLNRTIDTAICQGKSFFFKGQNRTTTGTYRDTIVNPSPSCDSIITLNLTIKNTSTRTLFDTICQGQSVVFKGISRTATGIYRDTLVNAVGCDSFLNLNLLVKAVPTVNAGPDTSRVNCSTDSVRLGAASISGHSYLWLPNTGLSSNTLAQPWAKTTTTTTYILEVTLNSSGCKLRDTLTLTVLPSTVNASVRKYLRTCKGASGQSIGGTPTASGGTGPFSYLWTPNLYLNNNTIANPNLINTQHGTYKYVVQVTDSKGCLARDTATVIIDSLPVNAAGRDTNLCRNFPLTIGKIAQNKITYSWNPATNLSANNISNPSFNSSAAGSFQYILTVSDSSNTCTLLDTITVQVNPQKFDTLRPAICTGQIFFFNGAPRTTAGTYFQTTTTSKGCDSFIVLYLTVNNTSTRTIDSQICQGSSVFFKSQNRTTTGTYRDTLINSKNCDSFVILNLVVNPTPTTNLNITICQGQSYAFNGNFLNNSGIYRDTLINARGCDSFLYLHLHVKDTSSRQLFDTICSNQFRSFNGINRNTNGVYRDTLINAVGCDSFIYLNLFVKSTSSSSRTISICANQSYFFKGQNRTTTGIYYDTISNSRGCDSFITLNLIVNTLSYRTIDTTICKGKTFFFKGQNRATAGTYRDTLLNTYGCDSFVTLILAFKDTSTYSYRDTICQNQPLLFNGQFRNITGLYKDTLINAQGCDSFLYLNLFVKNTSTTNLRDTICGNSFYTFKGLNLNLTGVYRDTLTNAQGCDSFVILNLQVYPTTSSSITVNICQGQTFQFKGQNESTSGIYYDTLTNKNGCDSFVTLNLIVNPLPIANAGADQTRVNCAGDSVRLGSNPNPSYSYLWSPSVGLGFVSIANPYSKITNQTTYYLLVTSIITGCQARDTVVINITQSQLTGIASTKNLRCHNDFSGTLNIQAANGYSPYNYKVDYMSSYVSSNIIANLSATPLSTYTIKDSKGCLYSDTFSLSQPDSISITTLSKSNLKCFNDNTGRIETKITGGIAPYLYNWSQSTSVDSVANNLISGLHTLFVTDDSLCLKTKDFTLTEPTEINLLDTILTLNPCKGDSSAIIKAIASGGTEPYQYKWSNGIINQQISNLKEGNYQLTIEDKNLCFDTFSLQISDPEKLEIYFKKQDLNCQNNSEINLIVKGGTTPYLYSINNGEKFQKDSNFWINKDGEYRLLVQDKNRCLAKDSISIGQQKFFKIQVVPDLDTLQLGESIKLGFIVLEGDSSQIQRIIWSPSAGLSCSDCEAPMASPYSTETYTVNILYANECETSAKSKLFVVSQDELYISNSFSPTADKEENKAFKIYSNNILRASLSIYDRWGEKIYDSDEPHRIGWNGEYKGEAMPAGVYFFYLDLTYLDGRRLVKKGEFNLIR